MFTSATDIYQSFLDGIRKTHTATVQPQKFVRIWNEWAMPEWIESNTSMKEGVELDQKQIDDLANIRKIYEMTPYNVNARLFQKPADGVTGVTDPTLQVSLTEVRTYLRALKVGFKLNYGNNASSQECGLTGISSTYLPATYLRSNMENVIFRSTYRKPKDSRLYYRVVGEFIQMVTDDNSLTVPESMRLDFLFYPNEMSYHDTYGLLYDLDLPFYQLTEIVQIAVRLYLERTQSPRWQSFFQEDIAKRVDKM